MENSILTLDFSRVPMPGSLKGILAIYSFFPSPEDFEYWITAKKELHDISIEVSEEERNNERTVTVTDTKNGDYAIAALRVCEKMN